MRKSEFSSRNGNHKFSLKMKSEKKLTKFDLKKKIWIQKKKG